MNLLRYYLGDAREGIRRNIWAAIATVLLIFISLSITGLVIVLKMSVDDVVAFLNSQVKIKVFVDPSTNTQQVADMLMRKDFIRSIKVETKEEQLDRLKVFFRDKSYLFESFRDSEMPDAILIELKNAKDAEMVAQSLMRTPGITDVIYGQKFAQTVLTWSKMANRYGILLLIIFIFASFLTTSIAMNLSLYQRQKEIRVKLLLGAKESHVRGQFLFEGFLLGLFGSILASYTVYLLYRFFLLQIQQRSGLSLFNFTPFSINLTMILVIAGGTSIGIVGAYISTRTLITNA
ncbi:MAG: permease-like cell division protein FtsX [Alicyclobacillaceae bacterium]|nr:permease-like cell division protein FtsX [Alicyclobacillaceae bacterium]